MSYNKTIYKNVEIKRYFEHLEEKQISPRVRRKEKAFPLFIGGAKGEWKDIATYFWERRGKFISDDYSLIMQRRINCVNKRDSRLKREIFINRNYIDKFTHDSAFIHLPTFLRHYDFLVSGDIGEQSFVKSFGGGINKIINKYKRYNAKCRVITNRLDLREDKLSDEQRRFFNTCKDAFEGLIKCNDKLKETFFVDLLDAYKHIPRCNVLVLYGISSINADVWYKLMDELDKSESKYKPDFIIATVESMEEVDKLEESFTDMFEFVPLKIKEKETKVKPTAPVNGKTKESAIFQTPKSTKWPDVEIIFIDNEFVKIKVKGKVINPRAHYSEMRFKHEQGTKPIQLWNTLRIFAVNNGIIIPRFDEKGNLIKTVSVDDVKRLRTKLRDCFGISDNPIPPYDKGKYIKREDGQKEFIEGEGYKTAFCIKR